MERYRKSIVACTTLLKKARQLTLALAVAATLALFGIRCGWIYAEEGRQEAFLRTSWQAQNSFTSTFNPRYRMRNSVKTLLPAGQPVERWLRELGPPEMSLTRDQCAGYAFLTEEGYPLELSPDDVVLCYRLGILREPMWVTEFWFILVTEGNLVKIAQVFGCRLEIKVLSTYRQPKG